ncbi:glutathione S-transferase U8-like [Malania oleifera]|uniref:glutathione S-transferase U8-like n=1 Tax=Malania oleifera TaxID=397392 RepID=UPI0025AE327C|nr:glutathione S-transferase U8-like [Malania oleifera]XP_057982036.1 glutathione S-transferase U8-like [Malania oleifera]
MGEEVKVLGVWASPFSYRVEIALKLKGIPYDYIEEEDLHGNKSELLLKSNPVHKKIPVFFHAGKPIAESLVILEYVDETWKTNPILPQDPYQRAMARFWAKFIDEKCMFPIWNAFHGDDKALEEVHDHLEILENELKDKRFFGGESIGLVDIVASFISYGIGAIQEVHTVKLLTNEKYPKLYKWSEEFVGVIKEYLPPRDKLVVFYKAHFEATHGSK